MFLRKLNSVMFEIKLPFHYCIITKTLSRNYDKTFRNNEKIISLIRQKIENVYHFNAFHCMTKQPTELMKNPVNI